MSDETYFPNGRWFIETRERVSADFLLFTPSEKGLSEYNREQCNKNNIDIQEVTQDTWDMMNQSLVFYYFLYTYQDYDYLTFCDFDTFFLNDWQKSVFKHDFTIGITTTEGYPQWNYIRSKANGGVLFLKNTDQTEDLLNFCIDCITKGGHSLLPQYDQIWKTLEDPKRKESKRHTRTNFAWWCDQVLLSAFVINTKFNTKNFPCKKYNALDSRPDTTVIPDIYIKHLKGKNRPVKGAISG